MALSPDNPSDPKLNDANDALPASDDLLFPLAASDHDSTSYSIDPTMNPNQAPPDTTSDDGYGSLSDSTYEIVSRSSVQTSDSDSDTNDAPDTDNESLASFQAPTPSDSNESDVDQPDTPDTGGGCDTSIPAPPQEREESFEEERLRSQHPANTSAESKRREQSSSSPAAMTPEEVQAEPELEIPSLDTSTIRASTALSTDTKEEGACNTSPSASSSPVDEWIHFEETPDVAEGLVDVTGSQRLEKITRTTLVEQECSQSAAADQCQKNASDRITTDEDADDASTLPHPLAQSSMDWINKRVAAARARLEAQAAINIALRQCRDAITHWTRQTVDVVGTDLKDLRLVSQGLPNSVAVVKGLFNALGFFYFLAITALLVYLTSHHFSSGLLNAYETHTTPYGWTLSDGYRTRNIQLHHDRPLNHLFNLNINSITHGQHHYMTFGQVAEGSSIQSCSGRACSKVTRRSNDTLSIAVPFGLCDDLNMLIQPIGSTSAYGSITATGTTFKIRNRCSSRNYMDSRLFSQLKGGFSRMSDLYSRFHAFEAAHLSHGHDRFPRMRDLRHSFSKAFRTLTQDLRQSAKAFENDLQQFYDQLRLSRKLAEYEILQSFKGHEPEEPFRSLAVRIDTLKNRLKTLRTLFHAEGCAGRRQAREVEMQQRREARSKKLRQVRQRLSQKLLRQRMPTLTVSFPSPKQQLVKARRRALTLKQRLGDWYQARIVSMPPQVVSDAAVMYGQPTGGAPRVGYKYYIGGDGLLRTEHIEADGTSRQTIEGQFAPQAQSKPAKGEESLEQRWASIEGALRRNIANNPLMDIDQEANTKALLEDVNAEFAALKGKGVTTERPTSLEPLFAQLEAQASVAGRLLAEREALSGAKAEPDGDVVSASRADKAKVQQQEEGEEEQQRLSEW